MTSSDEAPSPRPAPWALGLAFAVIYLTWGTTYFAIRAGVQSLPPFLFGGTRIVLAGLVLLAFLALRGGGLALSRRDLLASAGAGLLLFVGGNGLIHVAEKTVPSGIASVLVATTPLWIALTELAWPWGERLTWRGWLGLLVGLAGVLLLLVPRLGNVAEQTSQDVAEQTSPSGLFLVLASAVCWGVGSVVLRHGRRGGSPIASAAVQMSVGGTVQVALGLLLGEASGLAPENFTRSAILAFFYLLFVGSLLGFVTYSWLLQHVSAALAGTYAYVNPAVAVLVGWLLGGEAVTGWVVGGLAVILAGVALVRGGGRAAGEPTASVAVAGEEGGDLPEGARTADAVS